MFDPKRWAFFAFLRTWLRGGNLFLKGMLVFVLFILFFYLVAFYVTLKIVAAITRYFFVREGRQIRGGSDPFIRPMTLRRGAARVIDFAIIGAIVFAIVYVAQVPEYGAHIGLGTSVLYFAGAIQLGATTPGKSLFGLEVVTTLGSRLTPFQSFVRELTAILSIYVFPIALYVVLKNRTEEQMGDVVADTRVVKSRPSGVTGFKQFAADVRKAIPIGMEEERSTTSGKTSSGEETVLQPSAGSGESTILQGSSNSGNTQSTTVPTSGRSPTGTGSSNASTPTTIGKNSPRSSKLSRSDTNTDIFDRTSGGGTSPSPGSSDDVCSNCGLALPQSGAFCPDCGCRI